jgi:esterase
MKLNFKFYPIERDSADQAENLIILHGLFGSSKNWVSVSKQLSRFFNVFALDLRNHGDSSHTSDHSIPSMADDLAEFIEEHKLKSVWLLGHSMGGLVSMYFDLTHPNRLKSLIIQDISPRTYPFTYDKEIESMSIDLTSAKSRADVDLMMKEIVPDLFIRQFLQMNLERKPEGGYFWKLNVEGLGKSRNLFTDPFQNLNPSVTPALFLLGGASEYIESSDLDQIKSFFPNATIKTIQGGGHYVHYTHAEEFLSLINDYLISQHG